MGSHGIKDRVAIVGMGCTPFAEHFDKGLDDLLIEATDRGARRRRHRARPTSTPGGSAPPSPGMSGIMLAKALQLEGKPVTRVENYCATGSEALRQAAYAVASGAYDVAVAVGVEKVKDSGYQGLNAFPIPNDGTNRTLTAAAMFSMVAPAYAERYGVEPDQLRRVLARIASKNHYNGAKNPKAQFRKEMSVDAICAMPAVAGQLGVFDCAGVADGAAAAMVCRAEDAHRYTDAPLYIKALSLVAGNGSGLIDPDYDYTTFPEIEAAAADAYAQAGITDPRRELAMAEVHDCFTPTELVLMEDLGFSGPRRGVDRLREGHLRPRRRAAGQPRRRPQVLRPPGRRQRPADDVRGVAPAPQRGAARAPGRHRRPGPHPRPHPQPGRLPGRDGQLRRHRRHRAHRLTDRRGRVSGRRPGRGRRGGRPRSGRRRSTSGPRRGPGPGRRRGRGAPAPRPPPGPATAG